MTAVHLPTPSAAAPSPARPGWRRQRGMTMVESMMGLATAAVLLGTALPSLQSSTLQRRLEGRAAQLETVIQHARMMAVTQNRNLRLSVGTDAAGSCYVVHAGPAASCRCDAAGNATCGVGGQALHSAGLPLGERVQLASAVGSIVFDAHKGTVTPTTTLRLTGDAAHAVHVVVNLMGRVRQCTPAGAATVPGTPRC